jgi:hypothetical protein
MRRVEAMRRSPQLERSSLGMCECCHAIMSTREAQLTDELTALAQAAGEQRELAEEQRARLAERVRELQRLRSENARLRAGGEGADGAGCLAPRGGDGGDGGRRGGRPNRNGGGGGGGKRGAKTPTAEPTG